MLWCGDKVGIGHRLDSIILEVFSNLSDPVTLCFATLFQIYAIAGGWRTLDLAEVRTAQTGGVCPGTKPAGTKLMCWDVLNKLGLTYTFVSYPCGCGIFTQGPGVFSNPWHGYVAAFPSSHSLPALCRKLLSSWGRYLLPASMVCSWGYTRLCNPFFENWSRRSGCFWCFTLCCSSWPVLAGRCGQKDRQVWVWCPSGPEPLL